MKLRMLPLASLKKPATAPWSLIAVAVVLVAPGGPIVDKTAARDRARGRRGRLDGDAERVAQARVRPPMITAGHGEPIVESRAGVNSGRDKARHVLGPPGGAGGLSSKHDFVVWVSGGVGGALSPLRSFCSATIAKITGPVTISRARTITGMEIAIRVISVAFPFLGWK